MVFNVVLIDVINATKLNSLLNPTKFYLLYTFGGRFFEFFVGILLAKIILQNQKNSFQYFTWAGSLGVVTILGLLTIVCSRYQTAYGLHHPIGIILNNIVLPFAIATLLYGLMIEVTIVSKMLSSKFFHYLGVSSYCFYLIHVDLCSLMKGLTGSLIFDKIYLNLLFVVIVSLLLHYTIEEPCNNLLKKLFRNDKIS
jgi:peptidoglycan/LPS O-acetylase OafA/YrhL